MEIPKWIIEEISAVAKEARDEGDVITENNALQILGRLVVRSTGGAACPTCEDVTNHATSGIEWNDPVHNIQATLPVVDPFADWIRMNRDAVGLK
jgi:hypothetical protein